MGDSGQEDTAAPFLLCERRDTLGDALFEDVVTKHDDHALVIHESASQPKRLGDTTLTLLVRVIDLR